MLVIDTLLSGATTGVGTARGHPVLQFVFTSTTRVVPAANVRVEAGVILRVAVKTAFVQVLALGLGVVQAAGHVGHIRRSLTRVVLTLVAITAAPATLARVKVKVLLRACGPTHIAVPIMGTREVTLAAKGLRVPLLSVDVLTLSTDRRGRKLGGSGCVGVVQSRLAAGNTEGLSATVFRKATAVGSRFGSKRVVGNRPGGFVDGLLVGLRVGGDLFTVC